MAKPVPSLVDSLRSLFPNPQLQGLDDAELLRRFIETRDGDVFVALVHRHGPMVLGLARRIVRDFQLAEDVFQATFLVLGREARAVRGRRSLAAWLRRVAFRLAVRAKKARRRRREAEAHTAGSVVRDPLGELTVREYLTILDEELNRLPEKYRLPLILCQLEGLGREDAARRLGLSTGSVKARLERGRECLRRRLAQRGLEAGATLAALKFVPAARAVPHVLVQSTLQTILTGQGASLAVITLARGAINAMFVVRLQAICLAVLLVGFTGWGAVWLAQGSTSQEKKPSPNAVAGKNGFSQKTKEKRVDLYGDLLPDGAVMRLGTVQLRAAGNRLALSPDGKTLIGVRGGNVLSYWDVDSGKLKEIRTLPGEEHAHSMLSREGRWLVTERLAVWDLMTGRLAHSFLGKEKVDATGRERAFSPDGKYMGAVVLANSFRIKVWDLATGEEKLSKEMPRRWEFSEFVTFSPDGKKLLAYLQGSPAVKGTYCWDIASGILLWGNQESHNLGPTVPFHAPVFSADGGTLLSVAPPLDIVTGKARVLNNLPPLKWGDHIVPLPNGKTLLVGNAHGTLVWDMAASQKIRLLEGTGEEMLLSHDGMTLFINDGSLQRWDLTTGRRLYPENFNSGHLREVTAFAFSADGRTLASASVDGSVRLWDVAAGRPLHVWRAHEPWEQGGFPDLENVGVQALDMTPDGRWIVSAGSGQRVRLWDGISGKELINFPLPPDRKFPQVVYHLRIARDGKKATALFGGNIGPQNDWLASWELPQGKLFGKRVLERSLPVRAAISRDGKILASPVRLKVMRLDTLTQLARLEGKGQDEETAMANDGSLIALDYHAGTLLSETATGKVVLRLAGESWNRQMAFHPSHRFLAIDNVDAIKVWDVAKGQLVATREMPKGHTAERSRGSHTSCLAFTPDGRCLVTGHPDGTILFWDLDLPVARPAPIDAQDMKKLWNDLKDEDAAKAWRAVWRLVDSPKEIVPFLAKHVRPIRPVADEMTRPLIANLDGGSFVNREAATKRLLEIGVLAEPALRARLRDQPALETQRRIEAILKTITEKPPPMTAEMLRDLRAVAVLARIACPESRGVLSELAKGVDCAALTRAASAALGL